MYAMHDEAYEKWSIEQDRISDIFARECEEAECGECDGGNGIDESGNCKDCGWLVVDRDDIEIPEDEEREYCRDED